LPVEPPGFCALLPSWEGWRDASQVDKETRAKAVRLVQEHRSDYESEYSAMKAVSARLGMTAETLRQWVRQSEVDSGQRAGLSTESAQELRELRRECRELEQTIEVLKAATTFMPSRRLCGAGVAAGLVLAGRGGREAGGSST
jgi:transposase